MTCAELADWRLLPGGLQPRRGRQGPQGQQGARLPPPQQGKHYHHLDFFNVGAFYVRLSPSFPPFLHPSHLQHGYVIIGRWTCRIHAAVRPCARMNSEFFGLIVSSLEYSLLSKPYFFFLPSFNNFYSMLVKCQNEIWIKYFASLSNKDITYSFSLGIKAFVTSSYHLYSIFCIKRIC